MRYTVTKQRLDVIGRIWLPPVVCAQSRDLTDYDLGNIEDPRSREDVERWVSMHCGDFQEILDFRADFHIGGEHVVHEWEHGEESECTFADCVFPVED